MQGLIFHNPGEAPFCSHWQNVDMQDQVKNGGPNHLRAWRERRRISQQELADRVKTTPSVISYLEQGERGLSAKWLRKLAPALGITPGLLLDHDPESVSDDMIEMWVGATEQQKQQLTDIARTILGRTGTNG